MRRRTPSLRGARSRHQPDGFRCLKSRNSRCCRLSKLRRRCPKFNETSSQNSLTALLRSAEWRRRDGVFASENTSSRKTGYLAETAIGRTGPKACAPRPPGSDRVPNGMRCSGEQAKPILQPISKSGSIRPGFSRPSDQLIHRATISTLDSRRDRRIHGSVAGTTGAHVLVVVATREEAPTSRRSQSRNRHAHMLQAVCDMDTRCSHRSLAGFCAAAIASPPRGTALCNRPPPYIGDVSPIAESTPFAGLHTVSAQ